MRNTVLALVIATMATPALAQMGMPNLAADGVHLKTDAEIKQEQEREAGYKTGLGKIPNAKPKSDPWGNVRSSSPPTQKNARSSGTNPGH